MDERTEMGVVTNTDGKTSKGIGLKGRIFALLTVLLVLMGGLTMMAGAADYAGWYENAAGYEKAVAEYEKTGKPFYVYFYAPWCPHCKDFSKDILLKKSVRDAMKGFIKVRIYPETDAQSQALADQFGVQGYPTVFMKTKRYGKFLKVVHYKMTKDGKPLYLTPGGYVNLITKAAK